MKKLFILPAFFVIIIILFVIVGWQILNIKKDVSKNSLDLNEYQAPEENIPINTQPSEQSISWIVVRNPGKISLISNLEEKLPSKKARENSICQYLVSGGFYGKDNKHIGLFVSDGQNLSNSMNSDFFNGFFYVKDGNATISRTEPSASYYAIQAGPILIKDSTPMNLLIKNDEYSRRIVAAIDSYDDVVFLVIYDLNSPLKGPRLEDLPGILSKFSDNSSISIVDAINLDGGSHSAFISDKVTVTEVSPIGSYLCIKS